MFKSLALISVLASLAFAQSPATNTTGSAANATSTSSDPLIPNGITTSCTNFLTSLNSNSSLNSCLNVLTNATSVFAPGKSAPASSDITSALTNLCNETVTSTCPDSLIRQMITDFYAACPAELTTNYNTNVVRIYDVLYTLLPLQKSVCSKDDSGNMCAKGPSESTRELDEDASFGISDMISFLYMKNNNGALRRRDELAALIPNMTTYQSTNLAFLFYTPNLNATQLCTSCLRSVLTAYIQFESNTPYAPGQNNSLILNTQTALYTAVQGKCGATFLSGAVQAAGGLSNTGIGSSAIPTYGTEYQHITALVMGAMTLVASIAL